VTNGHLRDHAKQKFIGTVVEALAMSDQKYLDILSQEFNAITCGNMMWGAVEPSKGQFNWTNADKVVEFAQKNGMKIRGHNFIWHDQYWLPSYVKQLDGKKAELQQAIDTHIKTVAGHFKVYFIKQNNYLAN
jgi:endo-1,4-beta-xylanase